MREKLLDPTGTSERAVDTTLAPRLRSLRGLTAGLLGERQAERGGAADRDRPRAAGQVRIRDFRRSARATSAHPVEESLIQRILHNCDFAVAAIGD